MSVAPSALAALRARLLSLRDDVLRQLVAADVLDAGMLRMLGEVGAALAAIDGEAVEAAECAGRAVVSDDGAEIRMTLYRDDGEAVALALTPLRAVGLAGELVAASLPKLSR